MFGATYLADGTATVRRLWQERPGCARSCPPDRSDAASRARAAVSLRRPVQAVSADLAAVHGVADGAGGVRHDDVDFDLGEYLFRATGSVIKFRGFLALYREGAGRGTKGARSRTSRRCPMIEQGERVPVRAVTPAQHFTEPPPRYSEASLVKELERLGIGRPSTYASIISTLVDRRYAQLEQRRFFPTSLGESVEKVMVKQFPDVFNVGFTSGDGRGARQDRGRPAQLAARAQGLLRSIRDVARQGGCRSSHRRGARSVGRRERAVSRTVAASWWPRAGSSGRSWHASIIRRNASTRGHWVATASRRSRPTTSATSAARRCSSGAAARVSSWAAAASRSAAARARCRRA